MNIIKRILSAWRFLLSAPAMVASLQADHESLENEVRSLTRVVCRLEERVELAEKGRLPVSVNGNGSDVEFDCSDRFDTGGK